MDQSRKVKFSSYVNLLSVNKMFQYRYACVILCSAEEGIIFDHGLYFSLGTCYDVNINQLCSCLGHEYSTATITKSPEQKKSNKQK